MTGDVTLAIDAHTPEILSLTSNATATDTLIDGGQIIFTVDIKDADNTLTILPAQYNGRDLNWTPDGTGDIYTGTYDVTEGDHDQGAPLQLTGVTATDPAGNISNTFDGSDVKVAIDANTPLINSVTLVETGAGTLIVGDKITFTIDVDSADGSLTVSPPDYNGQQLDWYTNDGGDTYVGIYTVTEGDPDQTSALDLTNVRLTDPAGNVSSPMTGDVTLAIDAHTPSISSVVVDPVKMLYDQTITFTIEVSNDAIDEWSLVSGTIAGFNLFNLSKQDLNTYKADFTVGALGYDILPEDTYDVSDLVLSDPAGNLSNPFSTTINQLGDPIYTILPTAKVTGSYHVCDLDSEQLQHW